MQQLLLDDDKYDDEEIWIRNDFSFDVGGKKWIVSRGGVVEFSTQIAHNNLCMVNESSSEEDVIEIDPCIFKTKELKQSKVIDLN